MDQGEIREQLVYYARRAYERKLVRGTGGNFSARISQEAMLITGTAISLGDTSTDNLIEVNVHDYMWDSRSQFKPSKEYKFHADILRLRPDVGAVLHVHPPYATAFAVKRISIPMVTDAAFKQPKMPSVPFAPSGSEGLQLSVANAVREFPECKAILLEEHGLVALGAEVVNAFNVADLYEELAMIAYLSERL